MKNGSKGFYDVSNFTDVKLTLDDVLFLKDMGERRLFLEDQIDADTVSDIKSDIIRFNYDDKMADISPDNRKPIWIYLCSEGGSVPDGFGLIDAIESSKTPVYIVNTGYCYSMGFLIFLAGHKRFALKNAQFLMHDGFTVVVDSSLKAQDRLKFEERFNSEVVKKHILSHSTMTEKDYDKKESKEWYFLPEEALKNGMVEVIVDNLEDVVGGE